MNVVPIAEQSNFSPGSRKIFLISSIRSIRAFSMMILPKMLLKSAATGVSRWVMVINVNIEAENEV